jgi:hypothetical protein
MPDKQRVFDTGANRDSEEGKLDFEGFFSPAVLLRFAQYMHAHRKMADGSLRDSDNWQRGMPKNAYMKSLMRHIFDVWLLHRGLKARDDMQNALCGVMFNTMGLMMEELRGRQ